MKITPNHLSDSMYDAFTDIIVDGYTPTTVSALALERRGLVEFTEHFEHWSGRLRKAYRLTDLGKAIKGLIDMEFDLDWGPPPRLHKPSCCVACRCGE